MAVAYVNEWGGNYSGATLPQTVTLGTDATAGNFLIAIVFHRYNGEYTDYVATGWDLHQISVHDTCWHHVSVWTRDATGDSNDNFTIDSSAIGFTANIAVREYSGAYSTAKQAIAGIHIKNSHMGGWVYDLADGALQQPLVCPTATPLTSAGMILSVMISQDYQDMFTSSVTDSDTGVTTPTGYGNRQSKHLGAANQPGMALADKSYTSKTSQAGASWATNDTDGDGRNTGLTIFISEAQSITWPCLRLCGFGKNNTDGQTSASITVNGNGVTAGNLLIAGIERDVTTSGAGMAATGWTEIDNAVATGQSYTGHIFYREATGTSADDFAPSWTDGSTYTCVVVEVPAGAVDMSGTIILDQNIGPTHR